MASWITFAKERLPFHTYALLVGGLTCSGIYLAGGDLWSIATLISFSGLLTFFCVLRIMDEFKDFEKDTIAHPDRPLPRGIVTPGQVHTWIRVGLVVMLLLAVISHSLSYSSAALCYLGVIVYLWLMYREFFIGAWLAKRPLLYAASHQLIIIPICLFTPLLPVSGSITLLDVMAHALLVLSSFFVYEVGRKLDPEAHPILGTYLHHYGVRTTTIFIIILVEVGAIAAYILDLGLYLWPVQAILVLSLIFLFKAPHKYKLIEGIASLSLLLHVWIIPLSGIQNY